MKIVDNRVRLSPRPRRLIRYAVLATVLTGLLAGCGSSAQRSSNWATPFTPSGWTWAQHVMNAYHFLANESGQSGPASTDPNLLNDIDRYRRVKITYGCARTTPATLYVTTPRMTKAEPAAPCTTPQWGAFEGITTIRTPRVRGGASITVGMNNHIADFTLLQGLRKSGKPSMVPAGPTRLAQTPAASSALLNVWQLALMDNALRVPGVPRRSQNDGISVLVPRSNVSSDDVGGDLKAVALVYTCSIPYATVSQTTAVPLTVTLGRRKRTIACHVRPNVALTQSVNLGPVTGGDDTLEASAPKGVIIATMTYTVG